MRSFRVVLGWGALLVLAAGPAAAAPAYVRHPDLHGDTIVFAAEADLWLSSDRGGTSRRLTGHPGTESFPHFSPDGRWIAFSAQYDGNVDVFVVAREGGEPRRLTWHPDADEVLDWSPDGKQIYFRSSREQPNGNWEIFAVAVAGGDAVKLPLGWASRLAVDPASGRFAFTRTDIERATWKRYRGGLAHDLWVGSPAAADYRRVSPEAAAGDGWPMWHQDRIWFLSDRGGTQNLWSMRPDGTDRRQQTQYDAWDVRWPAVGNDGRIVFTLAAELHVLDPGTGRATKLEVELPSERTLTRTRYPNAAASVGWFDLSPDGERLAVVTRGEIFSVPVKEGVTLPITRGSGARESWGSYAPDGKRLVYVTDAPREEEIRVIDAWGRGEPETVKAAGAAGWHYPPLFSPDGKWIAYADQTQTLYVIPAKGGPPRQVDRSAQSEITDYAWSPDGRWLAYSKTLPSQYATVQIYDTKDARIHPVTGPTTNDYAPAWDPDGKYLYFLSDRGTNPFLGGRDWDNIEAKNTRLYLVLLRKDVPDPIAHLAGAPGGEDDAEKDDDEDESKDKDKGKDKASKKEDEKKKDEPPKPVAIDLDGLGDRVVELPIERGLYWGLAAKSGKVFYVSAPLKGFAEQGGLFDEAPPDNTLMVFELEKKEAKPFASGIDSYTLASKSDKVAFMKQRGEIYVVDSAAPPAEADLGKARVALDGIVVELDPREEWAQIFNQGWRYMRDFYWDAGLGGLSWTAERDRYAALLPRVASRADLQDLLGELIGEMNTSHTYVFGGDPGVQVTQVATGLLGAQFEREGDAFRITRIYRADPADNVRSPLDSPGAGLAEGDYILAVNHRPFERDRPLEALLAGRAGKEVVLTVGARPTRAGARDIVVRTQRLEEQGELIYSDWVRGNREYVARRSDGKIGYIHIPDMWKDGLIEFNTWFYPQLDREGMVVDVRWNGGGAVSQMIVERLKRRLLSFDRARGGGLSTYPNRVLNGPFVVLTNEFAGSDGDIFPMAIQLEELAPVIGMRSWGGVVGIRLNKQLVDGGVLTQPEFAWWDPKQGWDLENRGVIPDIEVQNLPQEVARGVDAQLDRGIDEVLRLHREHPPVKPAFGPARDRTRDAFRRKELPGGR